MENLENLEILSSYNFQINSHPNKSLFQHLTNVNDLVLKSLSGKKLNFILENNELEKIASLIAITHDFGKSTIFFQSYIKNENIKKTPDKAKHSFLSSLFTLYLCEKLNISKKNIIALVVLSHHGKLDKLKTEIDFIQKEQVNNISIEEVEFIYNSFLEKFKLTINFDEFKNSIEHSSKFKKIIYKLNKISGKNSGLESFFLTLFLFSLLVDADKLDAGIDDPEKIDAILKTIKDFNKPELVDNYKNKTSLDSSPINKLREEIYQEVDNYPVNLDKKIYSINVPTGTGKTFTSLNFALKLKNKLIKEKNIQPKIIYCLPFTSIIDQNYSVIEAILESNEVNITSDKLLKHHHLSDTKYTVGSNDDEDYFDTGKSKLLIENWMSSIVVTTFVQFFHSVISNQNKSLRKFHNIANSIVILDEVQAVPHKYWVLINNTLKKLSELFNTYFVLVTATQPLIFKEDEIVSVIEDKEKYFKNIQLNRINLETNLEKLTLDKFKLVLTQDIKDKSDKSFLIILNTIKSSQEIFNYLKDELNAKEIELKYLSTTILPFERKKIIEEIKDRKKYDKRYIVVSTQVVEAGVDIDLDIVYRDLAPLDSIFQAAGRCNRHAKGEKGLVKVFQLANENNNNKPFSEYVYDILLLKSTKDILTKKQYEESEFLELAGSYYYKVGKAKDDKTSENILKAMETLNFEDLKEFQLIENTESQDFFIELEEAMPIKEKILEIMNKKYENPWDKKNALSENKKEFSKYIVSVRLNKNNKLDFSELRYQVFEGSPIFIPNDEIENFYQINGIGLNFQQELEKIESGIIIV